MITFIVPNCNPERGLDFGKFNYITVCPVMSCDGSLGTFQVFTVPPV